MLTREAIPVARTNPRSALRPGGTARGWTAPRRTESSRAIQRSATSAHGSPLAPTIQADACPRAAPATNSTSKKAVNTPLL